MLCVQVLGLMLADGPQPAAIELLLGRWFIKAMLDETKPLDPKVFVAVAALLIASAALACTVPAWRASRIDPMQVLRME
jgi:ABC-type lipoprotein release transport system permease subunit